MQRKITDAFASLVQRMRGGDSEEEQALLQEQQEAQVREQSLLEAFQNQYWTRLVAAEDF